MSNTNMEVNKNWTVWVEAGWFIYFLYTVYLPVPWRDLDFVILLFYILKGEHMNSIQGKD